MLFLLTFPECFFSIHHTDWLGVLVHFYIGYRIYCRNGGFAQTRCPVLSVMETMETSKTKKSKSSISKGEYVCACLKRISNSGPISHAYTQHGLFIGCYMIISQHHLSRGALCGITHGPTG